jgi:cytochrome P450
MESNSQPQDWNPRATEVLGDPLRAYDALRRRCPVARSDYLHWSVLRHADVMRVLHDPDNFGNAASSHVSIPNGMDPPEHTPWRALVERYFTPAQVAAFAPVARATVRPLVQALPAGALEWMEGFAHDCAVRLLCAFMEWPQQLEAPLREWTRRNQAATLAGDRQAMAAVAFEFDAQIRAQLEACRAQPRPGTDPTSRLLRETIEGRPVRDDELVSILRNWTVGELSTLAASIGILAGYLAAHPDLQRRLRSHPELLGPAIDEILRIHPPLIANRRVVRQRACVGQRPLGGGARVTLLWASANRDEAVFGDPDAFRLDRDPALNLLYGAGLHVCPGADLSRLQLRVVIEELLAGTGELALESDRPAVHARYPAGGFSEIVLHVELSGA